FFFFFFFSSRRRHTRWPRDWSSDVCSSDLRPAVLPGRVVAHALQAVIAWFAGCECVACFSEWTCGANHIVPSIQGRSPVRCRHRSEERRVGKECRSRWSQGEEKKINVEESY